MYIKDSTDIPYILQSCISTVGIDLKDLIDVCIKGTTDEKSVAHHKIETLSIPGKICMENFLKDEIKN